MLWGHFYFHSAFDSIKPIAQVGKDKHAQGSTHIERVTTLSYVQSMRSAVPSPKSRPYVVCASARMSPF